MHLITAARISELQRIRDLLEDVEVLDADSQVLIDASLHGNLDIVLALLNHNANVNATGRHDSTALISASNNGHFDIVIQLLKHNADVNAADDDGNTALISASFKGHSNIVGELLKHKADVNMPNINSYTALIGASINGHFDVVVQLLENKANVDAKNYQGATALLEASKNGHFHLIVQLLKHKANVYATDDFNNTPMSVARIKNFTKIVDVMEKSMQEDFTSQHEIDMLEAINRGLMAEREALQNALDKRQETACAPKGVRYSQILHALDTLASANRSLMAERDILQKTLEKGTRVSHIRNDMFKSVEERCLRLQSENDDLASANRTLMAERDVLQNALLDKSKETTSVSKGGNDSSQILEATNMCSYVEALLQELSQVQNKIEDLLPCQRSLKSELDECFKAFERKLMREFKAHECSHCDSMQRMLKALVALPFVQTYDDKELEYHNVRRNVHGPCDVDAVAAATLVSQRVPSCDQETFQSATSCKDADLKTACNDNWMNPKPTGCHNLTPLEVLLTSDVNVRNSASIMDGMKPVWLSSNASTLSVDSSDSRDSKGVDNWCVVDGDDK